MTRQELLERLHDINSRLELNQSVASQLDSLIDDVESDGVLDVQCPADIADIMRLAKPAKPTG